MGKPKAPTGSARVGITKKMKIEEILKKYPETSEVFAKFRIHCVGCLGASFESIEQGAMAHGVDTGELIEDLNKVIGK